MQLPKYDPDNIKVRQQNILEELFYKLMRGGKGPFKPVNPDDEVDDTIIPMKRGHYPEYEEEDMRYHYPTAREMAERHILFNKVGKNGW